jgi:hypothetical protein
MWRIIGGTDTTSTGHPEGCMAFCLEFVDGSILLERAPEESFGDLEQTSFDLIQDMPNQSLELDTQLAIESISLDLICSLPQE